MPDHRVDTGVLNATFCATLVDEWLRCGVTDAVVSPGSRSTPLALAIAERPELAVHVHHDERAAGFIALGLGLATGRPAVVLTTSGTAAVELHPAVVEAHQSCVPLVVATADRPPELQGVGAPQTVDQTKLYGASVRWFHEPGPPAAETSHAWRSIASRSVFEAASSSAGPGPVHLNLAFREPLVGKPADVPVGRTGASPWHGSPSTRTSLDRVGVERVAELLDTARGVIVVGAGCGPGEDVAALAAATGWPILADARSGCRGLDHGVVLHADPILRNEAAARNLRPDVVLRVGEPPASKVLGAWLAGSGARQVAVQGDGRWFDADRTAELVVHASPAAVLRALACVLTAEPSQEWGNAWDGAERAASEAVERHLSAAGGLSEPGVARAVCGALRGGTNLVVSSSMPIRDVEWFGGPTNANVLSNRGANGIDGVVSTAIGVALASRSRGDQTVALVGDVAFLHDTNALLGLATRDVDLTVVVVDNDGGGIFSFLPQAAALDTPRFEQLFGTPHGVDLLTLASAHGIGSTEVTSVSGLVEELTRPRSKAEPRLILVRTDRRANVSTHDALNAAVSEAVEAAARG
ncbi:MAG: 2-succinyl-5-enolpyruvyl-6-hydroxy-3-cyclohexene-1-carboxylic-acid synthase [Acidimicrobiales bacterium]|nr:2-succinyl-5-enolpyruvyl-6-hydroxy-3-cyclohexene-1-carboxylic-acid synthase [Acidimicrobiales bacterium]